MISNKNILVTSGAGFMGSNKIKRPNHMLIIP